MMLLVLLSYSAMATTPLIKRRPICIPPESELWRQIASSDVIAVGKLSGDPRVDSPKVRSNCDLDVSETLKGQLDAKKITIPCGGDWEHEQVAYRILGSKAIVFINSRRSQEGKTSASDYDLNGFAEFPRCHHSLLDWMIERR